MPRPPRAVLPGHPLHLVHRGNNRAPVFIHRNDFQVYLHTLESAAHRTGCAVHSYVLMSNHVHLLLTPDHSAAPGRLVQEIGRRYVKYFNGRHARTGGLWEGRFRSTVVTTERYLIACSRYIELNPVRGGLSRSPSEYPWSSFAHNALGKADPLITPHGSYLALGRDPTERRAAYRAIFASELEESAVIAIRRATARGAAL